MTTTQATQKVPAVHISSTLRYGITERKKAELDNLTNEVLDASHQVEQFQAIVLALTEKLNIFQGFLSSAEGDRSKALSNRNLMDQMVQNTVDLKNNADIAFNEMVIANAKTKRQAEQIKIVMDKLIYSAELINKLAVQVVRKKALNPLISDELVSMITAAGNDANNAVALALIALKATFAAQASNIESEAATVLQYSQSLALYQIMTGSTQLMSTEDALSINTKKTGLRALFYAAYHNAKKRYNQAHEAFTMTSEQLNTAQANLDKAQVKLKSLQSGLAAGNAAALAS